MILKWRVLRGVRAVHRARTGFLFLGLQEYTRCTISGLWLGHWLRMVDARVDSREAAVMWEAWTHRRRARAPLWFKQTAGEAEGRGRDEGDGSGRGQRRLRGGPSRDDAAADRRELACRRGARRCDSCQRACMGRRAGDEQGQRRTTLCMRETSPAVDLAP